MSQPSELRIIHHAGLPREISNTMVIKNAVGEMVTFRGVLHTIEVKREMVSAKIVCRSYIETVGEVVKKSSGFWAWLFQEDTGTTGIIDAIERWSYIGEEPMAIDRASEYKWFLQDILRRKGIVIIDSTMNAVFDPIATRLFWELQKKKK